LVIFLFYTFKRRFLGMKGGLKIKKKKKKNELRPLHIEISQTNRADGNILNRTVR